MYGSTAVFRGVATIALTIAYLVGWPRDAAGALLPEPLPSETAYFLVAERIPYHHDSYVLPLTDPADIAEARRYVAAATRPDPSPGPPGIRGPIVLAKIARGADGINGDYVEPDSRPWSWHVTEFEGFTDFTIELIDGWPGFVQSDVDGWIRNTGDDGVGRIGFWGYTLVAELPNVPEPAGLLLLAPIVASLCLRRPGRAQPCGLLTS